MKATPKVAAGEEVIGRLFVRDFVQQRFGVCEDVLVVLVTPAVRSEQRLRFECFDKFFPEQLVASDVCEDLLLFPDQVHEQRDEDDCDWQQTQQHLWLAPPDRVTPAKI